ncbi:hypothetical protein BJ508DRAFT_418420 [Ascobolus immersus RN42]|uniref:Uncharacterized protein n=1 Tax=Ascobolus immersus RN42 TaxID=1160509 RepID=A0A3N4HQR9_ASCIM|nr:hypothetical protein BJ508DRAFT_418420 [Ascobolus immersus RN42]
MPSRRVKAPKPARTSYTRPYLDGISKSRQRRIADDIRKATDIQQDALLRRQVETETACQELLPHQGKCRFQVRQLALSSNAELGQTPSFPLVLELDVTSKTTGSCNSQIFSIPNVITGKAIIYEGIHGERCRLVRIRNSTSTAGTADIPMPFTVHLSKYDHVEEEAVMIGDYSSNNDAESLGHLLALLNHHEVYGEIVGVEFGKISGGNGCAEDGCGGMGCGCGSGPGAACVVVEWEASKRCGPFI